MTETVTPQPATPRYSLASLAKQEPNAIRSCALAIGAALVITGVVDVTAEALAAWGIALESLLTLLYVRPLSVSKDALADFAAVVPMAPPPAPAPPPSRARARKAA